MARCMHSVVVLPAVITFVDYSAYSLSAFTGGDSSCPISLPILCRYVSFAISVLAKESDLKTVHGNISI